MASHKKRRAPKFVNSFPNNRLPQIERLEDRTLLTVQPLTLTDPRFWGDSGNAISRNVSMSDDGQRVVFESDANNLVPNDFNGRADVFLYDRGTGRVSLVSSRSDGTRSAQVGANTPKITPDGRYVVFRSQSNDLVASPSVLGGDDDVYVRDLVTGQTTMISSYFDGSRDSDWPCDDPSIVTTADGGAMVVWTTASANMVPGDTNGRIDVFARKLNSNGTLAATVRVSVATDGTQGDNNSSAPRLSGNGRFVVFLSDASNFVPTDSNSFRDIFLRDLQSNTTELITIATNGIQSANAAAITLSDRPISDDGRFVVFQHDASNLVAETVQSFVTVAYVRDRLNGVTRILSRGSGVAAGVGAVNVVITGNGNFAGFASISNDVADDVADTNDKYDVFLADLRNLPAISIKMASVNSAGTNGGDDWSGRVDNLSGDLDNGIPEISEDGRYVAFGSYATNLVAGVTDTNNVQPEFFGSYRRDLFVRDMQQNSTRLVSATPAGNRTGDNGSFQTKLSPDGRYLAFHSYASDLVAGDANATQDVFLRDLTAGATELASRRSALLPDEVQASRGGRLVAATPDGRFVAFLNVNNTTLVPGVTIAGGWDHLYVRDTTTAQVRHATTLPNGTQTTGGDVFQASFSADGRFLAFNSNKSNLDGSISNSGIYLRDMATGVMKLISRNTTTGAAANASRGDDFVAVSPDGRWVAFSGVATNLINGVTVPNGQANLYVYDRVNNALRMVTLALGGTTSGNNTTATTDFHPVFSADSNRLVYLSESSNLVAGVTDTNNLLDVFAYDLTGPTAFQNRLVSVSTTANTAGNNESGGSVGFAGATAPSVSHDGRFVAFASLASNLTATANGGLRQVFIRDLTNNTTQMVSVTQAGTAGGNNLSVLPRISGDGTKVLFQSLAGNLTAAGGNGFYQLFVRDLTNGSTQLVSVDTAGGLGNANSGGQQLYSADRAQISPNGRFVAFNSRATDLVADYVSGGPAGLYNLYVRDLAAGVTVMASASITGLTGADDETTTDSNSWGQIYLSDAGRVTFTSAAGNLYNGDNNLDYDVFAYQYQGGGRILGNVFRDDDGSGARNGTEPGLRHWTVYLDANGNRRFDDGEANVQTDANGNYAFTGLAAGTYSVGVVLDAGFTSSAPAAPHFYSVTLATATSVVTSRDFGAKLANVDLLVDSVSAPTDLRPGDQFLVRWVGRNVGASAILGSWQDAVYLSTDRTLDSGDLLVALAPHPGGLGASGSYSGMATVTVPASLTANYYVLVQVDRRVQVAADVNRANNLGAMAETVAVTIPTLTLGTATVGQFSGGRTEQYFQVTPEPGKPLTVTLDIIAADGVTEVYVSAARLPTRSDFEYAGRANQADQRVIIPTAQPTTYFVLIRSASAETSFAGYTLTAAAPAFHVESLSSSSGSNIGPVTLGVRGSRLSATTQYALVSASSLLTPFQIQLVDATTAFLSFNLAGAPAGTFDFRATDGAATAILPGAFQIVNVASAATNQTYQVELITPAAFRPHFERLSSALLRYTNTSSVDQPAPLITIRSNVAIRLPEQTYFSTVVELDPEFTSGFSHSLPVLGVSPDGPAGILRPGQTGELRILFGTGIVPGDRIQFKVDLLPTQGTPAINWPALKDGMREPTTPVDAWDAIFANFLDQVGTNTQTYLNLLSANATYLSSLGIRSHDVGRILGVTFLQANASLVGALPASIADAVIAAPGGALAFSRSFQNTIDGRYTLGTLGRGWTHNWDYRLATSQGNQAVIHNGVVRLFRRSDSNGLQFVSVVPGDSSRFQLNSNGTSDVFESDGTHLRFVGGLFSFREDRNGNRVTVGRDANARITTITHTNGVGLTLAYNAQGRLATLTESTDRVVTFAYDASGEHLLTSTDDDGTTTYGYVTGQGARREHALASVVSPGGRGGFFAYDATGRLIETKRDGDQERVTVSYDAFARVTTTPAVGDPVTVAYNDFGRPETITDGLGRLTRYQYDLYGNLTELVTPLGFQHRFESNAQGLLSRTTNPLGQSNSFEYDAFQNLTAYVDPRGNITRHAYDARGNRVSTTYANDSRELFAYDAVGNLTGLTNRRGRAIGIEVDGRGRPTRTTYADGSTVSYTYDGRDNRLTATDASGTTNYTYELATDRLTRISYPNGRFLDFTHNADGQRTRSIDQDGFVVNYLYDTLGRLRELTNAAGGRIVAYTYDARGRLTRMDNGNGTATTYTFDVVGQLLAITHLAPGGAVNSKYEYGYDLDGRRTSMTLTDTDPATPDGTTTYGYDAGGQLTRVTLPGGRTIEYRYDNAGNRTQVIDSLLGTTDYEADELNQIVRAGDVTFAYDADGNLVSRNAGLITTYTYDDINQLIAVRGPDGEFNYEYDSAGNRRAMTAGGVRTEYLIDPTRLTNVTAEYGPGGLVAHYTAGLGLVSRVSAAGSAAYYDFDATGNVVGLTGAAGSYTNRYGYLPFGETTTFATGVANVFQFVGQLGVRTSGDGLHLMRYRNYSTQTGQFTSTDPIGLAGGDTNIRRYVGNAPTMFIDPSGLTPGWGGVQVWGDIGHMGKTWAEVQILDSAAAAEVGEATALGELSGIGAELGAIGAELAPVVAPAAATAGAGIAIGTLGYAALDPKGASELYNRATGQPTADQQRFKDDLQRRKLKKIREEQQKRGLPPRRGYPGQPSDDEDFPPVESNDPNDITGPAGVGDARFVRPGTSMPYRIRFENQASATAPAQEVFVTHQLDADLDWSTFELGSFGWGGLAVEVPAGRQEYTTRVNYKNLDDSALFVDVTGSLNRATGVVTWKLISVDPATGSWPEDPFAGFLPPNDATGRGDGFLDYVVRSKATLATGTTIDQQASIVFDINAPIVTNVFTNTIDASAPVATLSAPSLTMSPNFQVNWSSNEVGSGLNNYNVYASVGNGPFELWQTATTATSAIYPGVAGQTYRFYVVASDLVGNSSPVPLQPQAATLVLAPAVGLRRNGDNVELVDSANGQVLLTRSQADTTPLVLTGTDAAETLTLNYAHGGAFALAGGVRFDGGNGVDRLVVLGNNTGSAVVTAGVTLTGNILGTNLVLTGVDAQEINNVPTLTVGTSGGNDMLTAAGNVIQGNGLAPVSLSGVQTLVVDLGEGDGPAAVNRLTVNGPWTAPLLTTVTIVGGAGGDTLVHNSLNMLLPGRGRYTFNGGAGVDMVHGVGNANWTLTNAQLMSNNGTLGRVFLSGVEQATLVGGVSRNVLNASAFTGTTYLTGGLGNDDIFGGKGFDWLVEAGGNFTLTNTTLTGLGSDKLSSINGARLTGNAGNNVINAAAFVGRTQLDGGAGNDTLRGGTLASILLGGAGNDSLFGGNSRDVLIGGLGADTLTGGGGDDLLFGGTTSHDGSWDSLTVILAEWERTDRNYGQRIANLRNGGGRNGVLTLTAASVQDDAARDTLFGGLAVDWFWAQIGTGVVDLLRDRIAAELIR